MTTAICKQVDTQLDKVFADTNGIPNTYVLRQADHDFRNSLERNNTIVIYGGAKQGKSSLINYAFNQLNWEKKVVIHCNPTWNLRLLYAQILKTLDYTFPTGSTKKLRKAREMSCKLNLGYKFPQSPTPDTGSEIGGDLDGKMGTETTIETTYQSMEFDFNETNDIICALRTVKFNEYIILEDFHYLKRSTQQAFANELKTFIERNVHFIISGIWTDPNLLANYNRDLIGRISTINAGLWTSQSLLTFIQDVTNSLNFALRNETETQLINRCYADLHILKNNCRYLCSYILENNNIPAPPSQKKIVTLDSCTVDHECQQTHYDYKQAIQSCAKGLQPTEYEMHKWLLYVVFTTPVNTLEKGLSYCAIRNRIEEQHPASSQVLNLLLNQALCSMASLQLYHNIRPFIFDFNSTNKTLYVVDKSFIHWLNSLVSTDKDSLVSELTPKIRNN